MSITRQEQTVAILLGHAWNAFLRLPVEHDDDTQEFRRIIHAAQEKVLARSGRRQLLATDAIVIVPPDAS